MQLDELILEAFILILMLNGTIELYSESHGKKFNELKNIDKIIMMLALNVILNLSVILDIGLVEDL